MSELDDLLRQADESLSVKSIEQNPTQQSNYVDEETFLNDLSSSYGVDSDLLKAIDKAESGGSKTAVSPTGVTGRFQITKGTFAAYGGRNPNDFQELATVATKLVKDHSDKYSGDPSKIFAAYNAGPRVVDEAIEKASESGKDWKDEIRNTDAINDVTLSIMQAKKRRGNPVGTFSEEKEAKIKEIESHRNHILKFYNDIVGEKYGKMSVDELLGEADKSVGKQEPQSLDDLLKQADESLSQKQPTQQDEQSPDFVGPKQPLQKPFIGDLINASKNTLRQMLITVPSLIGSMDLNKNKQDMEIYQEKANQAKTKEEKEKWLNKANKEKYYIKTANDFRELAKSDTKGLLTEKETKRMPGFFGVLQDITGVGSQLVGQVGATAINPALGTYMMASQIGGNTVETLNKFGISDQEAIPLAVFNTAIQMPLSKIGLGSVMKSALKSAAPMIKKVIGSITKEGLTEGIQQIPDDILGQMWGESKGKNIGDRINYMASNWDRIIKNAAYAGFLGVVTGGGGAVVGHGLSKIGKPSTEQITQRGKQLASKIDGVKFDGIQEGYENIPSTLQFTTKDGATFYLPTNATSKDLSQKLKEKQEEFKQQEQSQTDESTQEYIKSTPEQREQIKRMFVNEPEELKKFEEIDTQEATKLPETPQGDILTPEGTQGTPEPVKGQEEVPMGQKETIDESMKETQPLTIIPERRTNESLRKKVSEMSPEEKDQALLTHPLTNIPNGRAYEETIKKPIQGMVDVDGLKITNDKMGYKSGDELLVATANALKESGVEVYHTGGDEFRFQGETREEVESNIKKAQDILSKKTLEATLPDGSVATFKGLGFSYGTAELKDGLDATHSKVTEELHKNKSDREKLGLRTARGEVPTGLSITPPKRNESQGNLVKGTGSKETTPSGVVQEQPKEEIGITEKSDYIRKLANKNQKLFDAIKGKTNEEIAQLYDKMDINDESLRLKELIRDSNEDMVNDELTKEQHGKKAKALERLIEEKYPDQLEEFRKLPLNQKSYISDKLGASETEEAKTPLQKSRKKILSQFVGDILPYSEQNFKDLLETLKKSNESDSEALLRFHKIFEYDQQKKYIKVQNNSKAQTKFKELNHEKQSGLKYLKEDEKTNQEYNDETNYDDISDVESIKTPNIKRQKESLTQEQRDKINQQAKERYGVEVIFTDLIRDRSGKIENLSAPNGAPGITTNGRIHLSTKLTPESALSVLSHEVVHQKGTPLIETVKKHQPLHNNLKKVWESDRDSDFSIDIETRYLKDIDRIEKDNEKYPTQEEKDAAIDDLMFKEWLGERTRTIETKNIDKEGNYIKEGKKDPILTRIVKAIKEFIKDKLGLNTSEEKIDKEVKKFIDTVLRGKEQYNPSKETKALRPTQESIEKKKTTQERRHKTFTKRFLNYVEDKAKLQVKANKNEKLLKEGVEGDEPVIITPKDLKFRFLKFANKYLVTTKPNTYTDQLIETVKDIKEVGDKSHQKAVDMVNEFISWIEISDVNSSFRKFKKINSKYFEKKIPELESINKQIEDLNKQFNVFDDYQTLKRLIDRERDGIQVSRKEGSKANRIYQSLIDKGLIIEVPSSKTVKGVKVPVTEYKISRSKPDAVEYYNKLQEQIKKTEFDKTEIQSKITKLVDDFSSIKENIKGIKSKNQEIVDNDANDIKEFIKNKKDAVLNKSGNDFRLLTKLSRSLRTGEYFTGMNMRVLTRILGKPFEIIQNRLRKGFNESGMFTKRMDTFLQDKLKEVGLTREILSSFSKDFHYGITSFITKPQQVEMIKWKIGNKTVELTKSQRTALWMYSKNEKAREELLEAGFVFKRDQPGRNKFNEKELNELFKTITPEEKKLADIMFEYYDRQGVEINKVSLRDIGVELATEKNYLPMRRKPSEVESKMNIEEPKSINDMQNFIRMGKPKSLVERKKSNAPIILDGVIESKGIQSPIIEKYIGLSLPSRQVESILNNIESSMIDKGMVPEINALKRMYKVSMNPSLYKYGGNKLVYAFDKTIIPAVLGLKPAIAVLQLSDAPLYFTQLPKGERAQAYLDIPTTLKEVSKHKGQFTYYVKKYQGISTIIDNIFEGALQTDLFETSNAAQNRKSFGMTHKGLKKAFSSEGFMTPMIWANNHKIGMYIALAETSIKKQNPKLDTDSEEFKQKVLNKVEPIIEATQPLFDALDKPEIQHVPIFRTQAFMKSQTIKIGQVAVEALKKIKDGDIQGGIHDLLLITATQTAFYTGLVSAVSAITGKTPVEEVLEIKKMIRGMIANSLALQGAIGDAIGTMFTTFEYKAYPPIIEVVTQSIAVGQSLINSLIEGEEPDIEKIQKKMDKIFKYTVPGYAGIEQMINGVLHNEFNIGQ